MSRELVWGDRKFGVKVVSSQDEYHEVLGLVCRHLGSQSLRRRPLRELSTAIVTFKLVTLPTARPGSADGSTE